MVEGSGQVDGNEVEEAGKIGKARFRALANASLVAIGADALLIVLKYVLAVITGSVVLSADALHSGGDLAVSLTVLISIVANYSFRSNVWARKAEGLVALFISLVLIIGSITVLLEVMRNVPQRFMLTPDIPLVVAVLGIGIACGVSFAMFRFKKRVGERHHSIAFTAEGMHTHSDFFTSFGVWLTLLLGFFGVHVERWMTLIIGLIVLRIGIKLLYKALEFFSIPQAVASSLEKTIIAGIGDNVKRAGNSIAAGYGKVRTPVKRIGFLQEGWVYNHRKSLIAINIYIVIFLYFATGYYSVMAYQTGVELLFGRVTEQNFPGVHYHAPKPFGNVILVDTEVAARVESGFRTNWDPEVVEPDIYLWEFTHTQGRYYKVPDEAITITGDENLVDCNFLCYYRIRDPVRYALYNDDSHEILRSLFTHEVRTALGHYHLDSLLSSGRGTVQEELTQTMKDVVEELPLGVEILQVYMQEAHPPIEVVPDYRAVASAREEKDEIVHRANAYANDLLPRSRGQGQAKLLDSQAYATEQNRIAQGKAENFLLRQRYFSNHQAVHEARLWWETVEAVLGHRSIYILPHDAKRRIYTSKETQEVMEE
jgi:membrane protease subunit HflK